MYNCMYKGWVKAPNLDHVTGSPHRHLRDAMRCRLLLSHQVADLLVAVEGVAGKGSAVRS